MFDVGSVWRWPWLAIPSDTAGTLLADLGEPEAIRKEIMGHRNITTTQRYTHLRPLHEFPAHERLAGAVPIADLVTPDVRIRLADVENAFGAR